MINCLTIFDLLQSNDPSDLQIFANHTSNIFMIIMINIGLSRIDNHSYNYYYKWSDMVKLLASG